MTLDNNSVEPIDGQTPLHPEDRQGLKPTWIATRDDLNSAESENIARATAWARRRAWTVTSATDATDLRGLHRRMFADVWTWAGQYRTHDTNVGVAWTQIPLALRDLHDDLVAQTSSPVAGWSDDEIAVRFHHRLVAIHCFPNGNGRHARLATDLLARALGRAPFTWGQTDAVDGGHARSEYLSALRRADAEHDYLRLIAFARS